jgi:tetratricopeptide (TPR) repeat protein
MNIGNFFQDNNDDTALYYHTSARMLAEKLGAELSTAQAILETALDHLSLGNYETSISHYGQVLGITEPLAKRTHDKEQLFRAKRYSATAFSGIGNVFVGQSDYSKAVEYYFRALKINEEIGNKRGQTVNLNNIGIIYSDQGDFAKALKYYNKALGIFQELGSKRSEAAVLGNIGLVFVYQGDSSRAKGNRAYALGDRYPKALDNFYRALKIDELIGNKKGMGKHYSNIGIVQVYRADSAIGEGNRELAVKEIYPLALKYFFAALKIAEEIGDQGSQSLNLANIGSLYTQMRKFKEAEQYILRGYKVAQDINSLDDLKQAYEYLTELYDATNKPALAYKYYKLFVQYRDSVNNEENTRKIIQQEYKFNYEKKFAADSVNFARENQVREAEIARQNAELKAKRNQQYALGGGLLMFIVFSVFIYNRFRVTRKQQAIIQMQKDLMEEKQKQILDSIHYAKRIQNALITNEKYIQRALSKEKKKA